MKDLSYTTGLANGKHSTVIIGLENGQKQEKELLPICFQVKDMGSQRQSNRNDNENA